MNPMNIPSNPLTTLRDDIRRHWKMYRPRMTARLEDDGTLEDRIEQAARETEEAILQYVQESAKDGALTPAQAFWQAWEIYRNEWAFLPAETDPEEDEDAIDEDEISLSSIYRLREEFYRLREQARTSEDEGKASDEA